MKEDFSKAPDFEFEACGEASRTTQERRLAELSRAMNKAIAREKGFPFMLRAFIGFLAYASNPAVRLRWKRTDEYQRRQLANRSTPWLS